MLNKSLIKLIALITIIAFTATNCGISYAADSSKIRQMQPMETIVAGAQGIDEIAKWKELKQVKLPDDEDTRAKCLQRLSCLNWTTIKREDVALLKAFVIEARKDFPEILTDQIINDALFDSNGVLELVRRSHPYTLQVLRNPKLFTHHFRRHEGMYYRLFALKLLEGKEPQDPFKSKIVFCVDSHRDYKGTSETGDETIIKEKDEYSIHIVRGVSDANWASAIIRDELADMAIMAYGFPKKPLLWYFFTGHKNLSGEVIYDSPIEIERNDFISLVDKVRRNFPGFTLQLYWTVDLDQFGLRPIEGKRQPVFFKPEVIPEQINFLLEGLKQLLSSTVSLTTADSRDYLAKEADETWITNARQAVKDTIEGRVSARASGTVTTYEVVTQVSENETIDARAAGYKAESATIRRSL